MYLEKSCNFLKNEHFLPHEFKTCLHIFIKELMEKSRLEREGGIGEKGRRKDGGRGDGVR